MDKQTIKRELIAAARRKNNGMDPVVINQTEIGQAFNWGTHRVQEFCTKLEPCERKRAKKYLISDVADEYFKQANSGLL